MEKVNDINKNMMQFFGNGAWNTEAYIASTFRFKPSSMYSLIKCSHKLGVQIWKTLKAWSHVLYVEITKKR